MDFELRYSQYNERSILIEWPSIIDENILNDVLRFKALIETNTVKVLVNVISSYNSLLVVYGSAIDNVNDSVLSLKNWYTNEDNSAALSSRLFEIPVCYEEEFAVDLAAYAKAVSRSKDAIINLHSSVIYKVYFIGFLPGFLYLGGLPKSLHLDRKNTPDLNIKKGAVGIGGKQTGIYPQDSPGGWHIIGSSPVEFFLPQETPPCFIKAGDRVRFKVISKSEYFELKKRYANASMNPEQFLCHD
ncbi:5-oxoprolinase subunit PxpB [Winogradskyella arenosi]|uniref:Inhibitor of KinA n=1 Tax=Winogradskyella arenosi TaxID=533325 RepID=A0A368ZMA6_9FLAO|nr:5-oxoprolinase subunit PxpB [Winogradskyella arenosi]RCW92765.1 inhibitor of KinA [Winogradskyella arenosi]